MQNLRSMQQQDPAGTAQGVKDAFSQDQNLMNNPVLMAILKILGLDPAQMGAG